jgi:hypothetical protein
MDGVGYTLFFMVRLSLNVLISRSRYRMGRKRSLDIHLERKSTLKSVMREKETVKKGREGEKKYNKSADMR